MQEAHIIWIENSVAHVSFDITFTPIQAIASCIAFFYNQLVAVSLEANGLCGGVFSAANPAVA